MTQAQLVGDGSRAGNSGSAGAFAYTWDIVGDPAAARRLAELGISTVTLQAAYHSVRALTGHHPVHRTVHAEHAAAYFPLTARRWEGRRLVPPAPQWAVGVPDRFGSAAAALRAEGLRIEAWLVLTHATVLGERAPDLTVRNAYHQRYPYALCPAQPEVAAYAIDLVREFCERYSPGEVPALMLEACGWLGFEHGSRHEKTHGADLSNGCRDLLSVCLCDACCAALEVAGADTAAMGRAIRTAVDAELQQGRTAPGTLREVIGETAADALLLHRTAVITGLVRGAAAVAGPRQLLLMAADDPQTTGPDSGLDVASFAGPADALVVKCWDDADACAARVRSVTRHSALPVVANVSVLDDPPDIVTARAEAVLAAGARHIRYYHVGLASPARLAVVRAAVRQGAK